MMNPRIEAAFNEQIKFEMESAHLYYQLAGWCASQGFEGMSRWLLLQKDEELGHAHRFFSHIAARGGLPKIAALAEPKAEIKSALELFREVYRHELLITNRIDVLLDLARKENDSAGAEFLQWFVREQVEEEEQASRIVLKLERIGPSGAGLVMLDAELGKRGKAA